MPPDPLENSRLRCSKSRLQPTFSVGMSTSKLVDSTAMTMNRLLNWWFEVFKVFSRFLGLPKAAQDVEEVIINCVAFFNEEGKGGQTLEEK